MQFPKTALACGAAASMLAFAVGVGVSAGATPTHHQQATPYLEASHMTGKNESPAGDANGRGQFEGTLRNTRLCYTLRVRGISAPVAAHIHQGKAGTSGPVVVTLQAPSTGTDARVRACVNLTATLAKSLRRSPGNYYVNVHTNDFPAGALRAQLEWSSNSHSSGSGSANGSGSGEVHHGGSGGHGADDGSGHRRQLL